MPNTEDLVCTNKGTKELTKLCRACLKQSIGMKYLLAGTENTNMLLTQFVSVLNLEMEFSIKYPSYLCKICEKIVNTSFKFREQCKASNDLILQYLRTLENQVAPYKNEENEASTELCKKNEAKIGDIGTFQEYFQEHVSAFSNYICCHCNESFTTKECLEVHIMTHNKELEPIIDNIKTENIDIHENELTEFEKDLLEPSNFPDDEFELLEAPRRMNYKHKRRLKQYQDEDVKKVIEMVREKLYRHSTCIFCSFEASSSRALTVHITKLHSDSKRQWCSVCNELFDNLGIHHQNVHAEDLMCPFCNKMMSHFSHFKEHMVSHSVTRPHKCTICKLSFISGRRLKNHQKTHVHKVSFGCRFCKKRFLQLKMLRRHSCLVRKSIEDDNKRLKENTEEMSSAQDFGSNKKEFVDLNCTNDDDKKVDKLKNDGLFKPKNYCQICSKRVRSVEQHDRQHHFSNPVVKEGKPKLCSYCGKRFRTQSKLSQHIRTHTGERPYKCRYCEKRIRTRNILVVHERTHTGERPYICAVCGKSFSQSSVLKTHLRIHTGPPDQCQFCEKRFCRPSQLRLHLRKHTGETLICVECNQGFKQKCNLVEHMRIHSGERPFKCNFCEKSFKKKWSLTCHLLIHSGDKPFKCSQCSYACRRPYPLTKHLQQHDNKPQADRPHTCGICRRSFRTVHHLTAHCKRFHSDLNAETIETSDRVELQSEQITTLDPSPSQFVSKTLEFVDQTPQSILDDASVAEGVETVTIHSELNQSIFGFTVIDEA